jgi:hypothetical protein
LPAPYRERHGDQHDRGKKSRRVFRGVSCGQGHARREEKRDPDPGPAVGGPDTEPCPEREQKQRHGVESREGPEKLCAREGGEQRRGEQRGPPSVQPVRGGPQQAGDAQHEAQRKKARRRQASDGVRERPQRGVHDGCPGKVGRKGRDWRLMQPVGPFQPAGPQVQGLVLKGCVRPNEAKRQRGLGNENREQRPPCARKAAQPGPLPGLSGRLPLLIIPAYGRGDGSRFPWDNLSHLDVPGSRR